MSQNEEHIRWIYRRLNTAEGSITELENKAVENKTKAWREKNTGFGNWNTSQQKIHKFLKWKKRYRSTEKTVREIWEIVRMSSMHLIGGENRGWDRAMWKEERINKIFPKWWKTNPQILNTLLTFNRKISKKSTPRYIIVRLLKIGEWKWWGQDRENILSLA